MQSSHTCHVNKTTNFNTLTVLRRAILRSGYLLFISARRRERVDRGTGGTTGCTIGTATAAGASLQWQNAVHCHCLTPRVTDVWPRRWRLLVSVDDKRSQWWLACLFGAPYGQGHLGFCSGGRVRRLHGADEPLPLGVFLRVGRRRWCWRLAGVVSCGTTSVVLVASRGRRWCWWLAGVVGGAGG